jgi:hypothetical protein
VKQALPSKNKRIRDRHLRRYLLERQHSLDPP